MSDILTRIPDVLHREPAVETNLEEFSKVVRSRRSVRVFEEVPVSDETVDRIIDDGILAPNSSNLQPWFFVHVKTEGPRKDLIKACLGQSAARTSQALVVVMARTKGWKKVQKEMIKELEKNSAPKGAFSYYKKIVPLAYDQGILGLKGILKRIVIFFRGQGIPTPRGPVNQSDMRVWAHKSAALACENIMLSARAHGLDSCPMEGFDEVRVKEIIAPIFQETGSEVCMVISIGKRAENGIYGPQIRMDRNNFVGRI